MKEDIFTKVVLTIIAINLTILTLKNLDIVPKAYANGPIHDFNSTSAMKYGLVPLNEDGTLTVKLSNIDELDINIVGIDTRDNLNVNLEEIGGGYVSHGGPIPVKGE